MVFPDIFQVEDDEDFAFFIKRALKQVDGTLSLSNAPNGREGLAMLDEMAQSNGRPGMILLDYNLPGMSGIDILKILRTIAHFDPVPIIVFSTSDNPKKAILAMEHGASGFQTKPIGYTKLVDCLRALTGQWLG